MNPNQILLCIRMLEAGIVPFNGGHPPRDEIRRGLNSLDDEENRKVRRKYRKLWRKAAKTERDLFSGEVTPTYTRLCSPNAEPSSFQRQLRRALVKSKFVRDPD